MKNSMKNVKRSRSMRNISIASALLLATTGIMVSVATTTQAAAPLVLTNVQTSTVNSATTIWTGSNYASWAIETNLGGLSDVKGNSLDGRYTWNNLLCGTTYSATLRLFDGLNQSGLSASNSFSVTTAQCPVLVPVLVSNTQTHTLTSLTTTWVGTGYASWGISSGIGGLTEATGNGSETSYTWSGLNTDQMYSASLRLYSMPNQSGESVRSSFALQSLRPSPVVTETPTPEATPTPTPTPQVPVVPAGSVKTGDGSLATR
jgi:hypothetical protein